MALLPPYALDSVVAIGFSDSNGRPSWQATGFLLGYWLKKISETEAMYRIYLVTNRHVLAGNNIAILRFNPEKEEPAREYPINLSRADGTLIWHPHPDADVDVGVVEIDGAA
jgi:hypothetical protein